MSESSETPGTDKSKGLILIVDDVLENLQVLSKVLRQANYQITAATSGEKALAMLEKSNPDLILLDVMMPGLSGFQVCQKIKLMERFQTTPIIFLTAKAEQEDILRGFETGAVDYVTKPFQFPELLARVSTHVELKRSREQLATSHQQLKQLSQTKDEFLRIVSHDLANPLNAIKLTAGTVRLYAHRYTETQLVQKMQTIDHAVKNMHELINNLLNVDAIDSGRFQITPEDFDLLELVRAQTELFHEAAQLKNLQLKLEADAAEIRVHSDKRATTRIFENVLSNALKYSEPGQRIWIRVKAGTQPADVAEIEIQDEGPGLDEADQSRLFSKFGRLTPQPTYGEESNGLGLYIVKQLIESLGGRIWCRSRLGEGSSFLMAWPNQPLQA